MTGPRSPIKKKRKVSKAKEALIQDTMLVLRMGVLEARLFREMAELGDATLDEIQLYTASGRRKALIVRIKYLAAKIAAVGWVIEKTTGRGRGVKASYTMKFVGDRRKLTQLKRSFLLRMKQA